jgi:UDP-N-acetylmuramoylalanine--D-glutamate ligase
MHLAGKRVTLMGLGRHGGGLGAARYLVEQGARLTITDLAGAEALEDSIRSLAGFSVAEWALGGHRKEDFRTCDVLVVNPAVRPDNPWVKLAVDSGAAVTSEIELFLSACPARVAGVTGSNGKSSTATMLALILQSSGYKTWLGGNLGGSLLADLPQMKSDDFVVLELSSFQLHWLSPAARLPELAIVTNCTPNHLDWHPNWAHYVAAKQRLLAGGGRAVVLNGADREVSGWQRFVPGRSLLAEVDPGGPALGVPGLHQRQNAACAAAAAGAWGCSPAAIEQGLESFRALPHRLEQVAEIGGRVFYDDSKSTTPESTQAALSAMSRPVWLLAGGYDKGVDFRPLLQTIVAGARGAIFFGATGPALGKAAGDLAPEFAAHVVTTLDEAVARAWSLSASGEAVLLSPACASFDQFLDYHERGRRFVELVCSLAP